jgi:predicted dehydrogenase
MKTIAIIGAGQLGSRHLQGIAQCRFDTYIEVVEPFTSSRNIAEERYKQIDNNVHIKSIAFFENIEALSSSLDLVIIATGADVRSKVIKELLSSKKVKNLVLEKVLFQTLEEYDEIEILLDETKTACWVNHPRRMFPFYKRLRDELKDTKQVSYSVQGGDWGLGCNGLHFIDHLSFLVGSENLVVQSQFLDNKLYASKRKGYIEFAGLLAGSIDEHTFSLHANHFGAPMLFSIATDTIAFKIDEGQGKIEIARKENEWAWQKIEEKIVYFQSELSQVLAEDLLIRKESTLPTYAQAKRLHVPFLNALFDKMEAITKKRHQICAIT